MTVARDRQARRRIEELANRWPRCFAVDPARRRPLKIGIADDIRAALSGAIEEAELGAALRYYVGGIGYLSAMRAGETRIDLDGNPSGIVTDRDATHAAGRIVKLKTAAKRETPGERASTRPEPPVTPRAQARRPLLSLPAWRSSTTQSGGPRPSSARSALLSSRRGRDEGGHEERG
jgi:ProP effector